MSSARLGRLEDHLKRNYIDSGRFPVHPDAGLPARQARAFRRPGTCRRRAQDAGEGRHHLPHLLDDQADHLGRLHDAGRGGPRRARRAGAQIHPRVEEPRRLCRRHADARHASPAPVPQFITRPVARPMQIVDLLRHTSGLTYGFQNRSNVDAAYRQMKIGEVEKAGTMQSMIDGLAKMPLEFSPGEAWNYSVSTDVLGYLVEKISGKPFEQFLKERIFDPLGMKDTAFHVASAKADRFAACYSADGKGGKTLQDDPKTLQLPEAAVVRVRRRRSDRHGRGLSDLLPRADPRRRDRRRAAARTEDAAADDQQSPAGRQVSARPVALAVRGGRLQRHRLRARLLGDGRSGADADPRQRAANTRGAVLRPRRSGSIRRKT